MGFPVILSIAWRRKWQPTLVFLPGESCGHRSLMGCYLWGRQSWRRLKRLGMHACIGEQNSNPLQYSCLENPRDGGAWWAAVYGVTQRWTRLKRLSSSSLSLLATPPVLLSHFQRICAFPFPSVFSKKTRDFIDSYK